MRIRALLPLLLSLVACRRATPDPTPVAASPPANDAGKIVLSDEAWRKRLPPETFHVMREKGTEAPFTGKYEHDHAPGVYVCAACGQPLFSSDAKFDSGTGWPSFDRPISEGAIERTTDTAYGMTRTEITCSRCGGHLGHVFDDGPTSTHLRYCINSVALAKQPK